MGWKTLGKRLLFPPLRLLLLLTVCCAAGLVWVFAGGMAESMAAYAVYALSFYTLCAATAFCIAVLPKRWRSLRQKIHAHPIGHRYLTDAAFKTHVSLYAALGANLLYVLVNALSWYCYRSLWFVVLGAYYLILAVMRFLLVRYVRFHVLGENRLGELRRARLCSVILLLVNVSLTGAVLMILYQNKGFHYHGILIYVMALYTFYMTTHAVVDLIRYRKYRSPVMTVSKVIALSAALVSMLALETAMLSQFGAEMTAQDKWLLIALTGAGVSAAVITMSVCMIYQTGKEIGERNIHGR